MSVGDDVIAYSPPVDRGAAPLFCVDCGADVNREVEPLTEDHFENFETASCAICETTFYGDGLEAGTVSTNTLTAVPEHLAQIANGDAGIDAERIVLKTAAGDVAIVARDGGLAVESA